MNLPMKIAPMANKDNFAWEEMDDSTTLKGVTMSNIFAAVVGREQDYREGADRPGFCGRKGRKVILPHTDTF